MESVLNWSVIISIIGVLVVLTNICNHILWCRSCQAIPTLYFLMERCI